MAVEVFAGESSLTLGMQFNNVPALLPWDRDADPNKLDVTKNGEVLVQLLLRGVLSFIWLAQPCQLLSLARRPQLRDWLALWGK